MLPEDEHHNDPVMMVAPDGTTIHVPRDEYARYRQEQDQPSPTRSDGELRDMVNPDTGQDMGGNPLQEGIWATTDNGWQPDYKRDESYASVKTAATTATPPADVAVHGGTLLPLGMLKTIHLNGVHVNQDNFNDLMAAHGKHSPTGGQPIEITAHHPAFEELAKHIIETGGLGPAAYKDQMRQLGQRVVNGEIPPIKQVPGFAHLSSYNPATVVTGSKLNGSTLTLLAKLGSVAVDGIHVSKETLPFLFETYADPSAPKLGKAIQVSAHDSVFKDLAVDIIRDGHGLPEPYKARAASIKDFIASGDVDEVSIPADALRPTSKVHKAIALQHPYDQYNAPAWQGQPEQDHAKHFQEAEQIYQQHGWEAAKAHLQQHLDTHDQQMADQHGFKPSSGPAVADFGQSMLDTHGGDAPSMWNRPGADEPINEAKPQPEGHQLNWTPGMRGRGIMVGPHLHTWDTLDPNDPEGKQIGPLHSDYIKDLGVDPHSIDYRTGVEIHPDGAVESAAGHDVSAHMAADPRLHPHAGYEDDLHFGHVKRKIGGFRNRDRALTARIEMPLGFDDGYAPREATRKQALLPLVGLAAGALRFAAPALMRGALSGGVQSLMGGGGGEQPAAAVPDQPYQDASFYSAVTDLSNPGFNEAKDGDTKQFDADSTSTNPDNPVGGDGQGGADEGEDNTKSRQGLFGEESEGIRRLEMMLPLVMHYHNSDDAGENDPILRSLHELLEQESPGYIDHHDDDDSLQELLDHFKSPQGVTHHKGAIPMPATNMAPAPGQGLQQLQNPAQNPQGGAAATCPNCGGVLVADGSCPQCGAKANPMGAAIPGQAAPGAPGMPPMGNGHQLPGQFASTKTSLDHQGPINPEQQKAVSELLLENGRQNEIPTMIEQPWNYAEEMAQVAQRLNVPPNLEPGEQPPPPPAQEVAPPGDTMPVPNPADPTMQNAAPQMMASRKQAQLPMEPESFLEPNSHPQVPCPCGGHSGAACPACHGSGKLDFSHLRGADFANAFGENGKGWGHDGMEGIKDMGGPRDVATFADGTGLHFMPPLEEDGYRHQGKQAADNVAPKCPNCGSHTTATDSEDGECHCHACQHSWKVDGEVKVIETTAHVRKWALAPQHPLAITDAEQHDRPTDGRDNRQDTTQTWADNANNPLSVGQTYEMHSGGYSIPDIVKVVAVKPDSIVVQTIGQYNNDGAQQPYTHELSKQEAEIEDISFVPSSDGSTDGQPDPMTADPQPASQVNTEPQAAPDMNARPSPVASVNPALDWLNDDNSFDASVTANYEKTAGKKYTPMEQRDFIDERGVARNSDKLDLSNTHYERRSHDEFEDSLW